MSFFNFLNMPKAVIVAIYEKIAEKANQTGTTVKGYLHEEKNIEHISLVVYDLLPLTVKFGLRHEKFHEKFSQIFKKIRGELFTYDEEQKENKAKNEVKLEIKEIDVPVKPVRKTRAKKTVEIAPIITKKVAPKKAVKTPVTPKTVKRSTPNAKTVAAIEESGSKKK